MKELLYDALATEFGLVVKSDEPSRLREFLYRLRGAEPEFADLSFVLSPTKPKEELWIVKRVRYEEK